MSHFELPPLPYFLPSFCDPDVQAHEHLHLTPTHLSVPLDEWLSGDASSAVLGHTFRVSKEHLVVRASSHLRVTWVVIMLSLVRLGFSSLFPCLLPVSYVFCVPLAYIILMWFASAAISTRGLYFLSIKRIRKRRFLLLYSDPT